MHDRSISLAPVVIAAAAAAIATAAVATTDTTTITTCICLCVNRWLTARRFESRDATEANERPRVDDAYSKP
jgi:hypothetical protein